MHLRLIERILDWLDEPTLVYRVQFVPTGPWENPKDPMFASSVLWAGASGVPGEDAQPASGPPPQTDWLHLSITRPTDANGLPLPDPPTGPSVAVMCALSPIPSTLRRFRLYGIYSAPPEGLGPSGVGDLWAATLVARDGDQSTIISTNQVVGATHQVRDGGMVTLGAGGEAKSINPSPKDVKVTQEMAYKDHPKVFQLWTDVDCYSATGWSKLYTPSYFWHNSWAHPFITLTRPGSAPSPSGITAIGVGLAMARGSGTPKISVKEFSIYAWSTPSPWWRRLISNLL